MAEGRAQLTLGASRGKLALAGVLAVVFVGVLLFQFGGVFTASPAPSSRPSPPARGGDAASEPREAVVAVSTSASAENKQPPRPEWPRMSIEQALASDPFAVSPALALLLGPEPEPSDEPTPSTLNEAEQLRAARLQETLGQLRTHGVSLIFDDGRGPVATVGDRMLRVGDVIGGFRVVDITVAEGVVLEAVDEQD
jgi:hypothetical protein